MPPKPGSEMPTIWAMGDSHSGHLQGMLYELHERLGVGVHLVETPGWSFPFPAGKVFAPRKEVFSRISRSSNPGISFSWRGSTFHALRPPPHLN